MFTGGTGFTHGQVAIIVHGSLVRGFALEHHPSIVRSRNRARSPRSRGVRCARCSPCSRRPLGQPCPSAEGKPPLRSSTRPRSSSREVRIRYPFSVVYFSRGTLLQKRDKGTTEDSWERMSGPQARGMPQGDVRHRLLNLCLTLGQNIWHFLHPDIKD